MRDIYLVDFENVASEGLSGITYLSPEDQVIIFYSANSNRLSMKMHILIGKSTCNLSYFEVSVGGKNALDHQISTWLGYLIGTGAAERSYYIVSRDMGYRHVANFWAVNDGKPRVKCVETIRAAVRLERIRQEKEAQAANAPVQETVTETAAEAATETAAPVKTPEVPVPVPTPEMLRAVTAPVLELKAAEVKTEAPVQPAEQAEAPAEQPEAVAPAEPEPLESLEDPEPGSNRKSYRGRTRFRRNRGKGHSNSPSGKHEPEPEQPKHETPAAPVEKPVEQPVVAEKKPEPKPEPKPEAPAEPKQPEKPASSERYSTSFWEKPQEPKHVEQKPEKPQESKPVEQKPEKKQEPKPVEQKSEKPQEPKPEKKPEKPAEPKQEPKPAAKPEPKPSKKPESKEPKAEKKQEAKSNHNKPQQKRNGTEKPRKPAAAKQEGHNLEQLPRLIAPYPQLQENTLKELIVANKRQVLCNTLRKQLGQEKGLALYNELKKTVWK